MKTFKLILKSLISNNACIDGGRKKPWYFAVIMFFLAMIFAILPLFVQTWNTNGDDAFKTYSYGMDAAALGFNKYLDDNGLTIVVNQAENTSSKELIAYKDNNRIDAIDYEHKTPVKTSEIVDGKYKYVDQIDYKIFYRYNMNEADYNKLIGDQKFSFIIMYPNRIMIHIVNFDTKEQMGNIVCSEACNKLQPGMKINDLLSKEADPTKKMNETFSNWKLFIRDAYDHTRLTAVWQSCAIMGGINVGITLFMGLMVWILTRGKNNPYRFLNLWVTQKTAWWAAITPSILALAFGFLIPKFSNILFPMLIGIRVMWLSMRSLRPDGSGYAQYMD